MANPRQLLSRDAVPKSPLATARAYQEWLDWMKMRRDPNIKDPWADTVRYDLNQSGYRCDEFEGSNGVRMFTIGCSRTYGTAIPYQSTFSYQLAGMIEQNLGLPTINWNLSNPGGSNDYVARVLSSAVPTLKPDLAIINFTFMGRREFITETGQVIGYTPNVPENIIKDVMHPEALDVYRAFDQLASRADDIKRFTLNYRLCEAVLEQHAVTWCYSTLEKIASEEIFAIEGGKHHIGAILDADAKAADGQHPGPEANRLFADAIFQHLEATGKLAAIKSAVLARG